MTQEKTPTFASADRRAKLAGHLARLIRRYRLDYTAFETVCKAARKETGLRRPAVAAGAKIDQEAPRKRRFLAVQN